MTAEQAMALVQTLPQATSTAEAREYQELAQAARAEGWNAVADAAEQRAVFDRNWTPEVVNLAEIPEAWLRGAVRDFAQGYAFAYRYQDVPPNIPGIEWRRKT